MNTKLFSFASILLASISGFSQDTKKDVGNLSGNFLNNNQFYVRDDKIGANTPVYLHQLSSSDAWLFLNYQYKGYALSLRYDVFNNSPLLNPQSTYSNHGIGYWQIRKSFDNLEVTAGSFYEQFGSGLVFRAYEDRNIGIDYAIQGVRLKYNFGEYLKLKGFTGNQKGNVSNRFGTSPAIIKGLNAEGSINSNKWFKISPGGSIVNRTLDNTTIQQIADEINTYPIADRFDPKYNVFAYNMYSNFYLGDFGVNLEYVGKTKETLRDNSNKLINKAGQIIYGTMTWSKSNINKIGSSIGINAQYKRTENYQFRTSPFETLLNGLVAYLPSITRQNTYRLLARYNAAVQELGETALQADAEFTLKHGTVFSVNVSHVESLKANGLNGQKQLLFEEQYVDVQHKFNKHWKAKLGLQRIFYNQDRYEQKPGYANVKTITPFGEITHKFNSKRSLRLEWQYLNTKADLGSFANVLLEYNIAPKFTFAAGDMLNVKPDRQPGSPIAAEKIHYYSFFSSYTHKASVFTLAYIKQLQGVNCSGGICRVEPAFSGVRFTVNTNF